MTRALWMHPVDLIGRAPASIVDDLRTRGIDAVRLAVTYHGGRLTVASSEGPRIHDLEDGGLLVDVRCDGPVTLERQVDARLAPLTRAFLDAAAARDLDVWGWTVLCHDDRSRRPSPDTVCVVNVQGDVLPYALCPARPAVRAYLASLCAALSRVPGLHGLDLEALGWLGVAHQSAHDKVAGPLGPLTSWLLSLCVCDDCVTRLGDDACAQFAARARPWLRRVSHTWPASIETTAPLAVALDDLLGADLVAHIVATRRAAARDCLAAIQARSSLPLDLRLAPSLLFHGGKAPLLPADVDGLAQAITYTWLGAPIDEVVAGITSLERESGFRGAVHAGFSAMPPTCRSRDDVTRCVSASADAGLDGIVAYCESLTTPATRDWLASAFGSPRQGVS